MINKEKIIFSGDDEETRLFLSKACDIYNRCIASDRIFFTKFLTPLQIKILRERFGGKEVNISFAGGYEGAERNIAKFSSASCCYDEEFPYSAILIRKKNKEVFSHRDYLGSVLSLGIKRELIGDIVVREEDAVIFCLSEISSYIEDNLFKIGNNPVTVREADNLSDLRIEKKFISLGVIVSSMRADCIVSAFCNVSRSVASDFIKKGIVTLNYEQLVSTSRMLKEGDVISIRGKGKFRIGNDFKTTKKGRLHITAEKYS